MHGLLFLLWALLSGCYPERGTHLAREARGGVAPAASRPDADNTAIAQTRIALATPTPTSDASGFEALEVPEFLPAVVFAPVGAEPYPLIVAAHGAGGTPEWECEYWQRLSRARAFLLCLRGRRTSNTAPTGYYYPTHVNLEHEFRAALTAFRERFGSAPRSAAVYAGFSQGATMGAQMILEHGDAFPYLALIEGGYDYWSRANAQRFAQRGGKRVLFVCGTQSCAIKSKTPATWLREANVEVRIEHAPGAGHTPTGEVMRRLQSALPWLTADRQQ